MPVKLSAEQLVELVAALVADHEQIVDTAIAGPELHWLPWYPNDFIANNNVRKMSDKQELWFRRLLDAAWTEKCPCFLPNDIVQLASLARTTSLCLQSEGAIVLDRFQTTKDANYRYNLRQLNEYSDSRKKHEGKVKAGKATQERKRNTLSAASSADSRAGSSATAELNTITTTITSYKEREIEPLGEDRDEKIFEVFRSHPANAHLRTRLEIPHDQMVAIIDAVSRDGFDLVVSGTRNLADAVALWPKLDRRFIPNPVKFFRDSEYLKDPSAWDRSMSAKPSVGTKLRKANLDDLYPQEEVNAKA